MAIRILIGAGKQKILKQLTQFFSSNGFYVVGEVDDGYDMLRKLHSIYPDICILDNSIKGLNYQELLEVIVYEKIAPVIVLTNEYQLQYFNRLNQEANFVPIIKPINKNQLLNTIQILIKTNRNIQQLEKEVTKLKKSKDDKLVINKAKQLLMKNMNLTEEEAHRRIQKQSMDKGISKMKIAEAIILMYE